MTTPETALPVISFQRLASRDPAELERLRAVCHEIGFFYLAKHPATALLSEAFAAARRFFARPAADKQAVRLGPPRYRGYAAVGDEHTQGRPDQKETLDFGFDADLRTGSDVECLAGPNPWPADDPAFRETVCRYMDEVYEVGVELMRCLALALGLPEDAFASSFGKGPDRFSLLRMARYPSCQPGEQGIGEHADFGFLTLLAQDEVGGLEVLNARGEWIAVTPIPDTLIVNLGDMLQVVSNSYLVSTLHRVSNSSGRERFSIPFFLEPRLDAKFSPLDLPADCKWSVARKPFGQGDGHEESKFGDLLRELPICYGDHLLRAFVRSFPKASA